MGKKNKLRSQRDFNSIQNDSASQMLTQQEEKMLYSTKRHTQQDSGYHKTSKRPNNQTNDMDEQEEDQMGQIQLSNLNHTSAEEITEFINKLIAKNKISSKNAFDIPLIHLEQMEDFRASLNDNTWKRLSSTLENDYKIYGYRVDATHTITYKMVESIARHEATNQDTFGKASQILARPAQSKKGLNQNDLLESFIDQEFSENVSKNKLNVDYTKFIEKNQKMLNIGHIEAFFGYNPGLEKTKRKFDQQGFKSLLLNNIQLRNGCELKLDEHYYNENVDSERPKEEMEEGFFQEGIDKMNQDQFDELLNRIQGNDSNSIIPESQENQKSIFSEIYGLSVNEANCKGDDFVEFERLYKIISGEDKEERRLNKKIQLIVQEKKESESKNVEHNQNPQNPQNPKNQQENALLKSQLPQPINEQINQTIISGSMIANQAIHENTQNIQNEQENHNFILAANDPNLPTENNPLQSSIPSQLPKQEPDHILVNKNFQMIQLNIDNLDQESQSSHSQQPSKVQYTGKLKNIEEYINIKEPTRKDKKNKNNNDELDPQEIGKRLFNRKYLKKKPQKVTKKENPLKDQFGADYNKKIDFNKLNKPSNDLKRSTIFKKSLTEERTYTQIIQKIKQKLQQKEKNKIDSKETDLQKKKKGKKVSKLFDLPIYQFQQGDINFVTPINQMDPQTSQLEFSDLFKHHFPSFVLSSSQILEEINQKKELKEKQILSNQRELEQKRRLEAGDHLQIIDQEQNITINGQENIIEEQNVLGNSDNFSPDISFIYDQMGPTKGNQVVIRQAKEKVRKIMLKMFKDLKTKKNVTLKKSKPNKLTFKNIYQAYYRQNGYISPALCFLTILHLANEHNLILEGKQDGSNFKIWVEEENKISQGLQGQEDLSDIKIGIEHSFFSRDESSVSSMRTQNEKILRDLSRSDTNN